VPYRANHITLGHLFLYLYTYPKLFFIYCTNAFVSSSYITLFVVTFGDLIPFLANETHVTVGWGTTYHLPLMTSSISSEYPTGHLPLPSEFIHFVPPLAQLIACLVVPLTLDLVEQLQPLLPHIYPNQGKSRVFLHLDFIHVPPPFLTSPSRFHEAICFWESRHTFCRHQHSFPEGRQYLDSHFPSNERSRMAQGEPQFLPDYL
jgi:hypothetical protein